MQKLRSLHLYLGCFFAPMLFFFALSGIWQEFGFQRYGAWLRYLTSIHTGSLLKKETHHPSSVYLQGFVILMGISLILTVITGVILAFKYGHGKVAAGCVITGILLPLTLILIFGQ